MYVADVNALLEALLPQLAMDVLDLEVIGMHYLFQSFAEEQLHVDAALQKRIDRQHEIELAKVIPRAWLYVGSAAQEAAHHTRVGRKRRLKLRGDCDGRNPLVSARRRRRCGLLRDVESLLV